MVIIDDWYVTLTEINPYSPPETLQMCIGGKVFGATRWPNGTNMVTSPIIDVSGTLVATKSGHIYKLGQPNKEYVEWCRDNGHHIPTEDEPLKLKK